MYQVVTTSRTPVLFTTRAEFAMATTAAVPVYSDAYTIANSR
jgi:hypothetical protein